MPSTVVKHLPRDMLSFPDCISQRCQRAQRSQQVSSSCGRFLYKPVSIRKSKVQHFGIPLSAIIGSSDKVVLKPNWVHHRNGSGDGLDCLVTHPSVIEAVLLYVVKANPRSIIVCDAPLQGCDFESLMTAQGLSSSGASNWREKQCRSDDQRLTTNDPSGEALSGKVSEDCQPMENYVLFDLESDSLLDPISSEQSEFRVTMYNPDLLKRTHSRGRHQYLVARDVIDANVVINLPKLKTHKKAGLTGALKNMVGINGHKEYLPHHRKGGAGNGGDCYAGRSFVKWLVEEALDATNRTRGLVSRSAHGCNCESDHGPREASRRGQ